MFAFLKKKKEDKRPRCAAVVAAAGSSSRMGGHDKLMQDVGGIPVLAHTLQALQAARRVDEIIVATREESLLAVSDLCHTYGITKCSKVVRGGESRTETVLLAAMEASEQCSRVAVQDGARPLVTPELIDRVIEVAERTGAAAPALPVKDTVKTVTEGEQVIQTLQRDTLRAVQTPQVFEKDLLKAALQSAMTMEIAPTDDCAAVERLGKIVYLIPGEETNLKITTPTDLVLAEALWNAGRSGQ